MDRYGQSISVRLLLEEHDQGLRCFQFCVNLLYSILYSKDTWLKLYGDNIILRVFKLRNYKVFHVLLP